jgi:hypothetical protein
MPTIVESPPLTIIGSSRPVARRRRTATASWIAPETAAHAPKAASVAPASAAKAAVPIAATATALIAALIRTRRPDAPVPGAAAIEATTSIAG